MKLVITIVQAYDTDKLLRAIVEKGLRATKISSVGGFLRMGNATILMGVEDGRVRECLEIALQAPSGSNAQSWRFVVVTDPEKKRALGEPFGLANFGVNLPLISVDAQTAMLLAGSPATRCARSSACWLIAMMAALAIFGLSNGG